MKKTVGKFPLRILFWESTLRCNAHCEFCGSSCGECDCSDELTTTEICDAFKTIAGRYDATNIMIDVSGGEPLVRPDLFEVMEYAHSLGFKWGIVTNGLNLMSNNILKLKQSGCKTISISLDGLEKTHDALRGVKGCYDKVVNGILALKNEDFLDSIMVTTVVSRKNFGELEELKNLLKTLPIDIWRICAVDSIGRAYKNSDLSLTANGLIYLMNYINNCRHQQLPFITTTSCSHYLGKFEFKTRDFPFHCFAGKLLGSILHNGDIFVCSNVPRIPSLIQGNIRKDNFVDIWENKFEFFRNNLSRKVGKCSNCSHYSKCRGDSLHTFDFEAQEPQFCPQEYGLIDDKVFDGFESSSIEEQIKKYKQGELQKDIVELKVVAQSLSRNKVLFSPQATNQLFTIFNWGKEEKSNEQMCVLLGKIFNIEKSQDKALLVCVEAVAELTPTQASDNELKIDAKVFNQIDIVEKQRKAAYCIVGFAHSHPNEHSIAMSLNDFYFHRSMINMNNHYLLNVILNPQKREIAAYTGAEVSHTELQLFTYK